MFKEDVAGNSLLSNESGCWLWKLQRNGELIYGGGHDRYITIEELVYVIDWANSKLRYVLTVVLEHDPSMAEEVTIRMGVNNVTVRRCL